MREMNGRATVVLSARGISTTWLKDKDAANDGSDRAAVTPTSDI